MAIDTTKAGSPGWWLKRLAAKLSTQRTKAEFLRSYVNGNAPFPKGTENAAEAYKDFMRKSRTTFGEIIIEAVAERMVVSSFMVNGSESAEARAIWDRNEMDVFSGDVHEDALTAGDGYAIVGEQDGLSVITYEDLSLVVSEQDPLRPNKVRAALKMYRDDAMSVDYAYLYLPGEIWVAQRQNSKGESFDVGGFEWVDGKAPQVLPSGMEDVIPVVRFKNRNGNGEFEGHVDILDRINETTLQRTVIIALQAFRQRSVKGDFPEYQTDPATGAPMVDADTGEYIKVDYAGLFKSGPDSLWFLPEGAEMWESASTDIRPILDAEKEDIKRLAAGTRTPVPMMLPDSQNQSAEGASAAREGLVFKINDRQRRAAYGWNQVMALALRFEGKPFQGVATQWLNADNVTLSEKADAASKAVDIPWETKMRNIWGFSPAQIKQMRVERMGEALLTEAGS